MVECTLFMTHCLRLNLQLHTISLFRTCRTSSFCTVAWQLARLLLTRRIARSLGNSGASCYIYFCRCSADGKYEVSYKPNVVIFNHGDVLWIPPAIYKSSCEQVSKYLVAVRVYKSSCTIDVTYFPFDQQECKMKCGFGNTLADRHTHTDTEMLITPTSRNAIRSVVSEICAQTDRHRHTEVVITPTSRNAR